MTHIIQLPFNVSYVSELSISEYETGVSGGGLNYSIFYNNNINSILININTPYTDYWDGYVWKICGKL